MPLGIGYPDEEERRRRMLAPPGPEAIMPRVTPRAPSTIPGEVMPPPPITLDPPTRRQRYEVEREGFMRETPGRGRSALSGALEGFGRGGGLIGAITGAASGAIDPQGLRERQFERKVRPRIMEQFAFEDAEQAARRQAEEDAINREFKTAQIGELNRRNLPEPPRPRQPIRSDRGLYDPDAARIIPGTEPLPPPLKEPTPIVRVNERGEYEDVGKAMAQGRKVKAFQKPEKGGTAKPKEKQKFVPLSKIREYAKQKGISRDQAEAEARADGYTIVR